MKKLLYLFLITVFTLTSSCKNFLDTKPENFLSPINYFDTEEQLNFALNGVYDILGKGALYGNSIPAGQATEADEGFYARATTTAGPNVYNFSTSDVTVLNLWTNLYDGINRANVLLDNLHKPQIDEVRRNYIKGEVLTLRAFYYFLLVINWGDVPLLLKPTASATGNNVAKTPSVDVYKQIILDLETAESLVKSATEVEIGGRISKSAVRGLLARVNLHWAGYPILDVSRYQEASKWAKMVIDDTESAHRLNPNYDQIFINYSQDKYDIKESIWEVEFWGNQVGNAYNEHGQIGSWIGIATTNSSIGTAYGFIQATERLYLRYEEGDLRRDYAIAPFHYVGVTTDKAYYTSQNKYVRHCGKWRRENETLIPKSNQNTPQNYPLVRYSDILLMFAEADNAVNNGPSAEAYLAVNKVRRRAFGVPTDVANLSIDFQGMDQGSFLAGIQDERSRELCFESLRKHDLIRWGIFLREHDQVASEFRAGAEAHLKYGSLRFDNVSSKHLLFPIPASEMALNEMLVQNSGW